ncbi:MAG: serine protease [Myxococcales bacterium]|nr:serine protease [Myxococcales bacterium]MCB9552099.1 serine protease [Myxococcales bacterium]
MIRTLAPLLLAAAILATPTPSPAGAPPALYDRAAAAAVEILTDDHLDGSGFIVDPKGIVVTAAHAVTDPRRRIEIRSPRLGRAIVRLIARDIGHDIALLALPERAEPYPALELAPAIPPVGTDLYLYGAPLFRHGVLLPAMLARPTPTYEYLPDQQYYLRIYHLGGPSPVGTSGGPWLTADARVVGLQSGLMHDGGAPVGIAYMAPVDAIRALLATRKDATTPTLRIGFEEIWEQPDAFRRQYPPQLEAVVAVRVTPGGPAARAGLRNHDVITHLDGERVRLRDEILTAIRARKPGDPVDLRLLRPGEPPRTVRVALGRLETEVARELR